MTQPFDARPNGPPKPPYLIAVDSGLTVTKAVVFDAAGRSLSVASAEVPQLMPQPHHVERDMSALWRAAARSIGEAVAQAAIDEAEIAAISVTGHGDGVYLIDHDRAPLGPAVLSLDSRAGGIVLDWEQRRVNAEALAVTGQTPMIAAPAAILAWIQRHEPERFARIGWALSCKDWLRLCLTGEVATDPTEASTSFTAVETQGYSRDALRLFGLEALEGRLPDILPSTATAGKVTPEAADASGLPAGLPVVVGLHDVTAAAVGLGMIELGDLAMVAGTYSINETILDAPLRDRDYFCRNAVEPGRWMAMAISPASSANIDWFLKVFCAAELAEAETVGDSIFDRLEPEIAAAFAEDEAAEDGAVVYHPFLFGSPHGPAASGAFLGLRGWHGRGTVMRAILEGIVFNHRTHVDALRRRVPLRRARLAGGSARSGRMVQLFADTLGMPVETVDAEEVSALGAALCAGVACGLYDDLASAVAASVTVKRGWQPDAGATAALEARFAHYRATIEAMTPIWNRLAGQED